MHSLLGDLKRILHSYSVVYEVIKPVKIPDQAALGTLEAFKLDCLSSTLSSPRLC